MVKSKVNLEDAERALDFDDHRGIRKVTDHAVCEASNVMITNL